MRFEKYIPSERLQPYIRYFAVSESAAASTYQVFPSTDMVIGFQYKGLLHVIKNENENELAKSGVTGLQDRFRIFKSSPNTGTILVYFKEAAIAHFTTCPADELFNQSSSLDQLFDRSNILKTEEKLATASTDIQRIQIVEQLLLSQCKEKQTDKLILEAVKIIHRAKGILRIKDLHEQLYISASPFEKRFRKIVGTTPKKFASVVRFKAVLNGFDLPASLTDLAYENNFFDQAHFIKNFKQYTGQTPQHFKRLLQINDFLQFQR